MTSSVETDRWFSSWRNSSHNIAHFHRVGPSLFKQTAKERKIKKKRQSFHFGNGKFAFVLSCWSFDDVSWNDGALLATVRIRERHSLDEMRFGFHHEFVLPLKVFWVWRMNEWVLLTAVHVTMPMPLSFPSVSARIRVSISSVFDPKARRSERELLVDERKLGSFPPFKWFALT